MAMTLRAHQIFMLILAESINGVLVTMLLITRWLFNPQR